MKISLTFLLLILLSGCNQENQSNTPSKENNQKLQQEQINKTQQSEEQTIVSKHQTFDFTYPDLEGKQVKLSDYRGKWVVVNFWATWCPPCRKEIPDFVKFKSQYGDKIEILGINNEDADNDKIQDFVFEYEINYPILRADIYNPSEFSKENTKGLPTTVIFNPEGIQVSKRVGPMHFKDLQQVINLSL